MVPNYQDTTRFVTVVVTDEDGLSNYAEIELIISPGNCPPRILAVSPTMDCLIDGQQLSEDVKVFDRDLLRSGSSPEVLTLRVIRPSFLTISPATITGPLTSDTQTVKLVHTGSQLVID